MEKILKCNMPWMHDEIFILEKSGSWQWGKDLGMLLSWNCFRCCTVKILCLSFGPAISCAYAPGYIQTFVSWTLFDLSNRKSLKNSTCVSCSVLTDFCQYLCLPLYRFLLSSFDHGTFGEVATVVFAIYVVVLSWNLKQKEDWLYVMLALMLLIELCLVLYEGSFQV